MRRYQNRLINTIINKIPNQQISKLDYKWMIKENREERKKKLYTQTEKTTNKIDRSFSSSLVDESSRLEDCIIGFPQFFPSLRVNSLTSALQIDMRP